MGCLQASKEGSHRAGLLFLDNLIGTRGLMKQDAGLELSLSSHRTLPVWAKRTFGEMTFVAVGPKEIDVNLNGDCHPYPPILSQ